MAPILPAAVIRRSPSEPILSIHSHTPKHIEDSKTSMASDAVEAWLEELRGGWGRFAVAFFAAGVDMARLSELSPEEKRHLECQLEAHGAKAVQIKQIRQAIKVMAAARQEAPQASPAMRNNYKMYQSPMAAYFGDDSFTNVMNFASNTLLGSGTPVPGTPVPEKSLRTGFSNIVATSCSQGLPCKSPMSAYFDGDCDDFTLAISPESTCVPSLADSSSNSSLAASSSNSSDSLPIGGSLVSMGSTPSFNLVQMIVVQPPNGQQPIFLDNQEPCKSALRCDWTSRSGHRVRWADESEDSEQKSEIKLTELLDTLDVNSASELQGRVWALSQDAQGCRDVQDAISSAPLAYACTLAAELRGHVNAAVQCPHANHVLRIVITRMPAPAFNFILEELMNQGPSHITEMAGHRFGCRIIEGLLAHGTPSQVALISACLLQDAIALCNHMYANFVMQRMFEHASVLHRSILMQQLHSNLALVGVSFYGSAVLGQALQHASSEDGRALAAHIVSVPGLFAAIAKYKHGKSIVAFVLDMLSGVEREAALHQLSVSPLKAPKRNYRC